MSYPSSALISSFAAVVTLIDICRSKDISLVIVSSSLHSFLLLLPLPLLLITRAYPQSKRKNTSPKIWQWVPLQAMQRTGRGCRTRARGGAGRGGRQHVLHDPARNQSVSQSELQKHRKKQKSTITV